MKSNVLSATIIWLCFVLLTISNAQSQSGQQPVRISPERVEAGKKKAEKILKAIQEGRGVNGSDLAGLKSVPSPLIVGNMTKHSETESNQQTAQPQQTSVAPPKEFKSGQLIPIEGDLRLRVSIWSPFRTQAFDDVIIDGEPLIVTLDFSDPVQKHSEAHYLNLAFNRDKPEYSQVTLQVTLLAGTLRVLPISWLDGFPDPTGRMPDVKDRKASAKVPAAVIMKTIIEGTPEEPFISFLFDVPADAAKGEKKLLLTLDKQQFVVSLAQETMVIKSPLPCVSEERKKELEDSEKRLAELFAQIVSGRTRQAAVNEVLRSSKRFLAALQIARSACRIRTNAETRLALHDKNFKKEQLEKVSEVATRVVAEFNARGRDASFSDSEITFMKAYVTASMAADVIEDAASPTLSKGMKKEQIQHAIEAGKAVLSEFNEKGEASSRSPDNVRILEIFQTVALATEITQNAQTPQLTQNLKKEEVQAAVEASTRILAEFNANEWKSRFADSDEKALENFRKALSASK